MATRRSSGRASERRRDGEIFCKLFEALCETRLIWTGGIQEDGEGQTASIRGQQESGKRMLFASYPASAVVAVRTRSGRLNVPRRI